MGWFNLLKRAAKEAKPKSSRDIDSQTIDAINDWARTVIGPNFPVPFPHYVSRFGDRTISVDWDIPADSWGKVVVNPLKGLFKDQFWLRHKISGYESRWINGETTPADVIAPNNNNQ